MATRVEDYCQGCLSQKRKKLPLGHLSKLLYRILEDIDKGQISSNIYEDDALLCWECHKRLQNVYQLQQSVNKAQTTLYAMKDQSKQVKVWSLSMLTTEIKYEDSTLNSDEIKLENEIKIDVKNEISDAADEGLIYSKCFKNDFAQNVELSNFNEREVKTEYDIDGYDYSDLDVTFDIEYDLNDADFKKETVIASRKALRRKPVLKPKFQVTNIPLDMPKSKAKIVIDQNELNMIWEKQKCSEIFLKSVFKCVSCVMIFKTFKSLRFHNMKKHLKSARYECDICRSRLPTKLTLLQHVRAHYYKYVCLICNGVFFRNFNLDDHIRKYHSKVIHCLQCGTDYSTRGMFLAHYRKMHQTFTCDFCGKTYQVKDRLIRHISQYHVDKTCKLCKINFKSFKSLNEHNLLKHTVAKDGETCYCVECDVHFKNYMQYLKHINTSIKHRPRKKKRIACPDCGKIYSKNIYMKNHFNKIHLQKTKYHCEKCKRYYLNGYALRRHIAAVHDKIPPVKNKICPYCGRGFSEMRILTNHIRTHTGERPHACEHCSATFAQKIALTTHTKNIHLKNK